MTEREQDGSDRPVRRRSLIAAHEIAEHQRDWIKPRDIGVEPQSPFTPGLTFDQRMARIAFAIEFYQVTEAPDVTPRDAEAIIDLYAENLDLAPAATLGRIEMNGEWGAADQFEREIFYLATGLYDQGYRNFEAIPRSDPKADGVITIPAGMTNERGYVALHRKRRWFRISGAEGSDLPALIIYKNSFFALDINSPDLGDEAAAEIRTIIAATMYKTCNYQAIRVGLVETGSTELGDDDTWAAVARGRLVAIMTPGEDPGQVFETALTDLRHLHDVMRRYDIRREKLEARLKLGRPTQLHDPRSIEFVEGLLPRRSQLLTPAVTSYFIDKEPLQN